MRPYVSPGSPEHRDPDFVVVVPFVYYGCPYCGSERVKTHRTIGRSRWHKCAKCRRSYKSWQVDADQVANFKPPPEAIADLDDPPGGRRG